MKYKVLIDTCIYKQMQYKFKEPYNLTLDLLKQQIDINKIEILMPIIVKKEIEKHLTPNIEQINTHLKNAIKEATRNYPWFIDQYYDFKLKAIIKDDTLDTFKSFIKIFKCKVIPLSYLSIEKVFEDYFKDKYPFESKKNKKNEFPDACSINMIKNYLKNDLKNLLVITTDDGFKNSFPKYVKVFSSINQMLSFLNSSLDGLKDYNLHLRRIETTKNDTLINMIQKDADNLKCNIISHYNNIDFSKFKNIFIYSISNYTLIGIKKDIMYISVEANYFSEIEIHKTNPIIDQNNVDTYEYQDKLIYNLEIKIIDIDKYKINKVKNNLIDDTINIHINNLFKIVKCLDI